ALQKLTKANLRFVISVSKQYQNQGLSLSDLINEGNLGLIKAAKRFDEKRGFKFISYAVWWIRQSILQAIAEHARIVRLPLNKIGTINKINKTFSTLEQEYERVPSVSEVAETLEVSEKEVKKAQHISGRHVSMDAPLGTDSNNDMYEVFANDDVDAPEDDLLEGSLQDEIGRILETLSTREADIIKLYFGIGQSYPLTLEEIGDKFDLTRERVRQLKEKGLRKLKQKSRSKLLQSYLG
ncbi:MAG: sigma-70 family RNA polymerase sigma factor, partial [Flavobacteriales bacterium]